MRADRLVAALLVLQSRRQVTARELADELEISVATARRDLEALSASGVPVYAQPGRNGGWSLVGGARTDLTGLRADEARALFTLVGSGDRTDPALTSALRKLTRALPSTFRDEASAASQTTVIDPAGWGEESPGRPELARTLQQAIARRRQVSFHYRSRSRAGTDGPRAVDPWLLAAKKQTWYLLGADRERPGGERRTFRLDRIRDLGVSDQAADPPPADVEQQWDEVAASIEGLRSKVRAELSISENLLWALHDQLGRHCRVLGTTSARARVEVSASTVVEIARHLAGWGDLIEVHNEAVRAELATIGRQLVESNAVESNSLDSH